MLWPKKADRAGLHARRPAWVLGLVRGRGRPLSSRAASRGVVAAARRTGHPAARVYPGRHDEDPDPVPSRIGPGAAAASRLLHECGAASLAARAPERDPGRAARSNGLAGCGRYASGLGGVAGGPDGALPPACIFRLKPPVISAKSASLFRNNPPPISAISPPLFRSHPPQLWVEGRGV